MKPPARRAGGRGSAGSASAAAPAKPRGRSKGRPRGVSRGRRHSLTQTGTQGAAAHGRADFVVRDVSSFGLLRPRERAGGAVVPRVKGRPARRYLLLIEGEQGPGGEGPSLRGAGLVLDRRLAPGGIPEPVRRVSLWRTGGERTSR